MAKEIKTRSAALMLIIITGAILVIINLISLNLFSRADLTDDNIYSLSDASRGLVEGLSDRLTVRAYISEDLPSPHNGDARYLKDLLDDYRAYSNGKLGYEFIDPVKTNKEQEAMGYRVPPIQFNVFRNDKTEFIKAYKGLVLIYGDKQEVLPFIENTENLEYDLSRAIKKLTVSQTPFIGFTIGNGEPDMSQGLSAAFGVLQQEYQVQFMDLDNLRNLPPNLSALFVVSPKGKLSPWELYLIDQFIMRGGKVAFLLDRFEVDMRQSMVTPIDIGLDSLLIGYGIAYQNSLAIDMQCNVIPVMRQMGAYQVQSLAQYPYFIKVANFSQTNPVVKDLNSLDLLFASPLDVNVPVPENITREIILSTSEYSGTRMVPIDISPEKQYIQSDFNQKNLPLAAVLTGKFTSQFSRDNIPQYVGPDTASTTPLPQYNDLSLDVTNLVAVGCGSFVTDEFRRNQAGFIFLLNLADWLTQDKGLISIRSRANTIRTLEPVSDATRNLLKYVNILAMPLAIVIFGLVRWQVKRALRKKEAA